MRETSRTPALSFALVEDCMECGACCFSESPRHARVTGDDYERLGEEDAERWVVFDANQAFMRLTRTKGASHCAALTIDSRGTFTCSIYDRRPQVCRDLERGGGACEGERATKHDRTRRVLLVLHSACMKG